MKKYVIARTEPMYGKSPQTPINVYACSIGVTWPPTYDTDLKKASQFDSIQEAQNFSAQLGNVHPYTVHEVNGQMVQDLGI